MDDITYIMTFSVAGPTVWNSLPDKLSDPSLSIDSFRRQLKTFLFADQDWCTQRISFFVDALYKSTFTYLLTYLLIGRYRLSADTDYRPIIGASLVGNEWNAGEPLQGRVGRGVISDSCSSLRSSQETKTFRDRQNIIFHGHDVYFPPTPNQRRLTTESNHQMKTTNKKTGSCILTQYDLCLTGLFFCTLSISFEISEQLTHRQFIVHLVQTSQLSSTGMFHPTGLHGGNL